MRTFGASWKHIIKRDCLFPLSVTIKCKVLLILLFIIAASSVRRPTPITPGMNNKLFHLGNSLLLCIDNFLLLHSFVLYLYVPWYVWCLLTVTSYVCRPKRNGCFIFFICTIISFGTSNITIYTIYWRFENITHLGRQRVM